MCDLFDNDNMPPCRCRQAVVNGYTGMKQSGAEDSAALDVACRIYRFYHPEQAALESRLTVECWVNTGSIH